MSARPETNPATEAEGQQPMLERPMGRRTLLRAAIITVPVVAAFARNAWALTARSCPSGSTYCATCAQGPRCILISSPCNGNCNSSKCGNPACIATPLSPNRVNDAGSSMTSPFNANQSSLNDGGFNSSPWQ